MNPNGYLKQAADFINDKNSAKAANSIINAMYHAGLDIKLSSSVINDILALEFDSGINRGYEIGHNKK